MIKSFEAQNLNTDSRSGSSLTNFEIEVFTIDYADKITSSANQEGTF